ncbi:MAG: electron transport complex protein RnfC [Sulfobacillus acidophilus]|uniref:Electron transport complex protein RnfC n=1 Tax=Sulfobacillus acidophilus TaxID=53633 RepID=A0A2T2WJD9_9FIRM|nr:MAG: electron transport complex protein RnfC [Sulfobacillus acidophilus]
MPEIRRLLPTLDIASAPTSLERLRERGFERALQRSAAMTSQAIVAEVQASGIKGRGGAAFPTGAKWAAVLAASGEVRYAVMNADESELGTFKDRALLEQDPLGAMVGLVIAARAVGAKRAYCYVRGEYREVEAQMGAAIQTLRQAGWVGADTVDIEIRRGAGAYIAGEETALLNSIEGKRAEPRVKPPFPTTQGLWRSPTLIQNVETLANVALLFAHDVDWFRTYGTPDTPGTKLIGLSGHIEHPGVYEVPFGYPLMQLITETEMGHGVSGSGHLGAVLLGGAAGTFLAPDEIRDSVLDYGSLAKYGASIGSGAFMVFDDTVDLTWVLTKLARFFADESCGQCVPCRVGTRRILEFLQRGELERRPEDLRDLAQAMKDASICGLGQTAPVALLSILDRLERRTNETRR